MQNGYTIIEKTREAEICVCVCVVKYIKHKLGHFNNFELHISGVLIMFSMCD